MNPPEGFEGSRRGGSLGLGSAKGGRVKPQKWPHQKKDADRYPPQFYNETEKELGEQSNERGDKYTYRDTQNLQGWGGEEVKGGKNNKAKKGVFPAKLLGFTGGEGSKRQK